MPSLSDLPPAGGGAPPCARCGKHQCSCPPRTLSDLVAAPGFRPQAWQAEAPRELFSGQRFLPVQGSTDLERVLALPRRELNVNGAVDYVMGRYALPRDPAREAAAMQADDQAMTAARAGDDQGRARWLAEARRQRGCRCHERDALVAAGKRRCIARPKPMQAVVLREIEHVGGLLGFIPVGAGKTFLGVLGALALGKHGVSSTVLLVPPTLCDQLWGDLQLIAEHFWVPEFWMQDGSSRRRKAPNAPVVHVMPYSRLSRPDATDWLTRIAPQAIIADEADKLRDPGTATTSRVLRYFLNHGNTRFCCWTGSMTDKSIRDYAHLSALALREGSPLPLDKDVVDQWAMALDPGESMSPPGELLRLCEPGEEVHDGFRRRLCETPGVIIDVEQSVDVEIVVETKAAPAIPRQVQEALDSVRNWVRPDTMAGAPDDEDLVDAMSVAKCALEVACGLFYYWIFPRGEPDALIDQWYEARRDYNGELRQRLKSREEYLDSPMLCELAAQRHWGDRAPDPRKPTWASQAWPRWRDIRDKVKPETRAHRISDYLARDAAEWALTNRGIVWYSMIEFGSWVSEISGLPLHGGGPGADERIKKEVGNRSIIASIKSHGRGRNGLQLLFADNLIVPFPSSSAMAEQLLGRTHRQEQMASVVRAVTYDHTEEMRGAIDQVLRRAQYVRNTIGASQKLLVGWNG